jgi:hypothetical protein
VLALAGLARLGADRSIGGRALLEGLLAGLPRMLLPLTACPGAPAQGALAIECRADDQRTRTLLAAMDDASTRAAVAAERALLAERGGGCHQRFGATQIDVPGLGSLLYVREDGEALELRWTPATRPPALAAARAPWDGSAEPARRGWPLPRPRSAPRARCRRPGAVRHAPARAAGAAARRGECLPARLGAGRGTVRAGRARRGSRAARRAWASARSRRCSRCRCCSCRRRPTGSCSRTPAPRRSGEGRVIATYAHGEAAAGSAATARHDALLLAQRRAVRALARPASPPGRTTPAAPARPPSSKRAGVARLSVFPSAAQCGVRNERRARAGAFSVAPARARLLAALAVLWLVLTLSLVGWWSIIVLRGRASRSSRPERRSGRRVWSRTRVRWASRRVLALLLALSATLAWLYWREQQRVRALQAFFASVTH